MIASLRALAISLLASLALFSAVLWIGGFPPLRVAIGAVEATWLSPGGAWIVLNKATLLILTGLAVAIPRRAGLFNIGGEGQMYMGGLCAALTGAAALGALGKGHMVLCAAVGTAAGALWGWAAGWLLARRNVHEVIGTIMLNFIAFHFVNEMVFGPFQGAPGAGRAAWIQPSAELPPLAGSGMRQLTWGIVPAVLLAAGFSVYLRRAWSGFHLRAAGSNPEAAAAAGISIPWTRQWALILGGACAGLAGAIETTGITRTFHARFSPGLGFDGIAIAFLALAEPWAVIPAALFLATLRGADAALQLDLGLPKEMVFILEGLLIVSIASMTRARGARVHD